MEEEASIATASAASGKLPYRVSTTYQSDMIEITENVVVDSDDYAVEQLYTPCNWYVFLSLS